MAWQNGYVTEIGYNFGYYTELNPIRVEAALASLGFRTRPIRVACELGFGQGLSIGIHAASNPHVTWWGNDFNPTQAGFAQKLVSTAGVDATLSDESFSEFCQRDDLPQFDFIALHGIWSWVSEANRAVIAEFLGRKLAVGGVVYISYNTEPGWIVLGPVRHLMKQYSDRVSSPGKWSGARVDEALSFVDELLATDPMFSVVNAGLKEKFEALKTQPREYLAHEYFNRDWHPTTFAAVSQAMSEAKLSYVGSAAPLDHQDPFNLTPAQMALINSVEDGVMRETARDFILNQQFRRDLWVKGPQKMLPLEQVEALRAQRMLLVSAPKDVPPLVKGRQGEVPMNAAIYEGILSLLGDNKPRLISELERHLAPQGIKLGQIVSALGAMSGAGSAAPVATEAHAKAARASSEKLNLLLMDRARSNGEIGFLASPVLGGGVPVSRFDQLFLLARTQGAKTVREWAEVAAAALGSQGQKIIKDGRTLDTPEEALAELITQATAFDAHRLSTLKMLGIG